MPHTQDGRLISINTPLGKDKLLLAGFSGVEAISRLFSFQLDLLTEQGPIEFSEIVGTKVTISVNQADNTARYFNGLVKSFTHSGGDNRIARYSMEVVPWTWKLTRFADCRIFHDKTVRQVIEKIFSDRGLTDFEITLDGTYTPMEYCVQYRETDFNFISRLMEQNGIFYFFKHEQSKHTMVIADSANIHGPCPGHAKVGYDLAKGGIDSDDSIHTWTLEQELRSGLYSLTDYNFTTPSASLLASESTIYSVADNSKYELFDYPGEYANRSAGTSFAKLRMQEEEAVHLIAHGSGSCRAFTSGYTFALEDHPQDALNQSYLLTAVQHLGSVAGGYLAEGQSTKDHYSNHHTCIPADIPFRPARVTPKPFVQGPQSATVVGESANPNINSGGGGDGNEIWVDKYGRVIVRFPWDRKGDCSCWLRVSQDWAGAGWGSITIPRVGQEVLVSFLEGDPDRPIITGRVYNASQTVPYALPANGTRSTFMTRSSKGGSSSTYNELRFEDKTGSEQVFVRGQRDADTRILHDSREWVGNNRSLVVTTDQMESVGGDLHSQVTGNVNQKVGQTLSLQVGQNLYEKSGTNYGHEAGQAIHLKAGMTIVLEAETQISFKVGGNFITIDPSGVSIAGTMVMINSGGSAGDGCGSNPNSPTKPDEADDGSKGTKMS